MKTLKIPRTKEEAVAIYTKRRKAKKAYLKYDMFLGGIAGCDDDERRSMVIRIASRCIRCNVCKYNKKKIGDLCIIALTCEDAAQETLRMRWNERID